MGIHQPEVDNEGAITSDGMYFDPKFLVEKYMNFTDEDLKLNEKYKRERREQLTRIADAIKRVNAAKGGGEEGGDMGGGDMGGGGMDFGGGADMGGGMDLGGGAPDEGGDMGGEEVSGDTELGI